MPKEVVPLVLHRIVHGDPTDWDGVRYEHLEGIVHHIGQRWTLINDEAPRENARWLLTFDDGYASDYDVVFPLLSEKGLCATFFLITGCIGSAGHLTRDQAREMSRYGMKFGSHSRTHRRMTSISSEDAAREFIDSRHDLEDLFGCEVDLFSYPFGECSPRLHEIGLAAGYRHLFTSAHGFAHPSQSIVPRNALNSTMTWCKIMKVMEPNAGVRLRWWAEDFVKDALKRGIGRERYVRWRNRTLRRR